METIYWISPILNIFTILGIILALWIAGRLLPDFISWIRMEEIRELLSRPPAKTIFWIALGGLFALPVMDFVGWLGNWVNLILVSHEAGAVSTMLGSFSQRVYSIFPILLMIVVYGVGVWLAMGFLSTPGKFGWTGRLFMVFSVTSLAFRGIQSFFAQIFSFRLPLINIQQNFAAPGFLLEVLIGILVFLVILVGLNKFLPTHPMYDLDDE